MTIPQAKQIISAHPNAKNFVRKSHLEDMGPLFERHIEVIAVRMDQFHGLSGYTYMPKKETLDLFADAAGVSFVALNESTRKDGDACYVGTSQAKVMGPDGKDRTGDICEYEFDVEVYHEDDIINDKTAKYIKYHDRDGNLMKDKARRHFLELKKAGRARANTGARSRAILNVLGMETGFKNLFGKGSRDSDTVEFLFSRVIMNAKNEMVAKASLDSMFQNKQSLFGPEKPQAQIADDLDSIPHAEIEQEPIQPDTEPVQPVPNTVVKPNPFTTKLSPVDQLKSDLAMLRQNRDYADNEGPAFNAIDQALAQSNITVEDLTELINTCKSYPVKEAIF